MSITFRPTQSWIRFFAAALVSLVLTGPAAAAGGVYCLKGQDGLKVFAGRVQSNGELEFGLSVWNAAGNHIGVFGQAPRVGDHWVYSSQLHARQVGARCRLEITFLPDGAPQVTSDPKAACRDAGGHGTEIGKVRFPRRAYEGPVTTELRGPEAFFSGAGKCG